MPFRLDAAAEDFASEFEKLLHMKRETSEDVDATVRDIIADVMRRGDDGPDRLFAAVRPDRADAGNPAHFQRKRSTAAVAACPQDQIDALKLARDRIVAFHERQRPADLRFTDDAGVELGWRWSAVESVGLYVPGGTASYPSSVLMNALPAKVAGVERLVMVAPAPDGKLASAGARGGRSRRRR